MIPFPAGPFGAIVADPPWRFVKYAGHGVPTRAGEPYDTMTFEQLAALPVPQIAARDCALFLWVIDSHLPQAWRLIGAWGFAFSSVAFVWVKICQGDPGKPRMGMGLTTRKESEQCLLAFRGKPRRQARDVRQVIMAPRREHSRKPDCALERVERLYAGPYLELFARSRRSNWCDWGEQAGRFESDLDKLRPTGAACGRRPSPGFR
jgi:N6-adenosine-specific RNA methylase IME4